ncbi:MAG: M23 family metallopeptidase [Acidimicrobiia bacterium]|nr:M23 family metallopeptidase [Acidimicrobiia bacterium]
MHWRIVAAALLLVAGCGDNQTSPVSTEQPGATAVTGSAATSSTGAPTTAAPPTTTVAPSSTTTTAAPPTTTTTLPAVAVHVFPLDPPSVGDYSPGGHSYQATDIFAPVGTRFVAVTSGVVQGTSRSDTWDPEVNDGATRGGLFVSLIGDDGVRYYGSHLSAVADGIEAGVRVEAGQLLGLVGVSGSARDTPPHLHFGISRPTSLDDWEIRRGEIDPVPFLDAWRAGDTTATPEV